jgi:endonuclease YncB( thermonuclease family)
MVKKMKKILVITFLTLFFFSNSLIADSVKVIDGDTIIVNNEKIRFFGIDAPELKQTCEKDEKIVNCGISAKKILIKKIGKKIPECITHGKDIYKRTIAECYVEGESLSVFLVRNGYAFAYRKYSKKFVKDEEFAKANNLGMWSMKFQYPWNYRKSF